MGSMTRGKASRGRHLKDWTCQTLASGGNLDLGKESDHHGCRHALTRRAVGQVGSEREGHGVLVSGTDGLPDFQGPGGQELTHGSMQATSQHQWHMQSGGYAETIIKTVDMRERCGRSTYERDAAAHARERPLRVNRSVSTAPCQPARVMSNRPFEPTRPRGRADASVGYGCRTCSV